MKEYRTPTAEQQQAIDLFRTGDGFRIQAGAGTGKTTTLAMCARDTQRPGAYLAFNQEIAREARDAMPVNVTSCTMHSAAARAVRQHHPSGGALLERLGAERVKPWHAARYLGLGYLKVTIRVPGAGIRQKVLQPGWQASHIMRGIERFCASADPEPTRRHFPYIEGIDAPLPGGARTYENNDLVSAELEPYLRKAWADVTSPVGRLRFTHDVYLKLAQLHSYPITNAEFVLFDEAQDANPVMLAILAAHPGQVVYVGDSCQQIYEWRGAVDALAMLDLPTAWLTQSWRFGPAIAEVANLALDKLGAELRIVGTPSICSQVVAQGSSKPPRAVLCRTNAVAVQQVLNAQEHGQLPFLVGGADDIVWFAQAAGRLMAGERAGHPELSCFDTWREVRDYVENDPQGGDLRMLVSLVNDYGPDIVVEALSGLGTQHDADVVVSTAHRAKGREWERVRIAGDFDPEQEREVAAPEWRLLYVAATRATHVLDIRACAPLRELVL